MKKFLLGLVTGVVLCGLAIVVLLFAIGKMASSFGDKPVTVAEGSTLVVKLEGELPEKAPPEIPLPFFEEQAPLTVQQVWDTFHRAASDSRVKGILFEPRGLAIGWGIMQEIHEQMLQFKKSGKPVVAFLRSPGAREYYLASAADKVYMAPEDSLDLKGLRVETMYFKNTLDKIGVKADVIHAGKYKDFGDMFTQTSMSPETSEVLNQILDQFYGNLIDTIAQGRKKQSDAVRGIIDQGPFMATEAQSNGLVDTLGFEEQAADDMRGRLKQGELKRISIKSYLKSPVTTAANTRRIAFVVGEGEITTGNGNESASDQGLTSTAFVKLLKQVEDDSSIKGVIIRINSPGGDGVASDDMLHEAKNLSKKKPTVISMGDVAASGGYFMAATGDPIVAYPNTLTGSIGVVYTRMNLHGLYDKIGITKQLLTRGHYADLDSEYVALSDDDRRKLTSQIDGFYKAFVNRVADARKKPFDQIEPLAQGRVWLGEQAKQNGLVDELGGLDKAVEMVRQRANIAASDKITLVPFPAKRSIFEMILNHSDDSSALMQLKLEKALGNLPVAAIARGGFLKLMPYSITVK